MLHCISSADGILASYLSVMSHFIELLVCARLHSYSQEVQRGSARIQGASLETITRQSPEGSGIQIATEPKRLLELQNPGMCPVISLSYVQLNYSRLFTETTSRACCLVNWKSRSLRLGSALRHRVKAPRVRDVIIFFLEHWEISILRPTMRYVSLFTSVEQWITRFAERLRSCGKGVARGLWLHRYRTTASGYPNPSSRERNDVGSQ